MIGNDVILLAVEDPCCNVGSGGATLNALLVVTEHISARQGYTVRIILYQDHFIFTVERFLCVVYCWLLIVISNDDDFEVLRVPLLATAPNIYYKSKVYDVQYQRCTSIKVKHLYYQISLSTITMLV